jgi:hypothetical protein
MIFWKQKRLPEGPQPALVGAVRIKIDSRKFVFRPSHLVAKLAKKLFGAGIVRLYRPQQLFYPIKHGLTLPDTKRSVAPLHARDNA